MSLVSVGLVILIQVFGPESRCCGNSPAEKEFEDGDNPDTGVMIFWHHPYTFTVSMAISYF